MGFRARSRGSARFRSAASWATTSPKTSGSRRDGERADAMNATVARLVAVRLGTSLLTLLVVSVAIFAITELLPGDVAEVVLGQSATPEAVAGLRAALHLDQPAHLRYLQWLSGLVTGDPGRSLVNSDSVAALIGSRLPNSLLLAAVTTAVSVPVALTLGITAAMWRGSLYDRAVSVLSVAIVSVPEFFVATVAVLIFAVKLRWLPALSYASDIRGIGPFLRVFAVPVLSLRSVGAGRPHPCPAERRRADRQRHRAKPLLSARRRDNHRNHLQLPGSRKADGRCGVDARHAAGSGLRDDLLRRLPAARHRRGSMRHPVQPAAALPMSVRGESDPVPVTTPPRALQSRRWRRIPLPGLIGLAVVVFT